jgi:hypothetical protein
MRKKWKLLVAALVVVALPSLAWGIGFFRSNTTGVAPEEMRGELAGELVKRWSPYVEKTYGTSGAAWSMRMQDTLKAADISNLERAITAPSYQAMNAELMGRTMTVASRTKAGVVPKALGSSGSDLVYTPITPCRIVDTRLVGGALSANSTRSFRSFTATDFTSQGGAPSNCGIPANVSAISAKITSPLPAGNGYFTAYPFGEAQPLASSLNYNLGLTLSDETHIRLCRPGCSSEFNVFSFAQSQLVLDVTGYYMEPEATALDCTVAQESGNLALLGGLQPKFVNCPAGYTATGGGCGGPLGIAVSNSEPNVVAGQPVGWKCDLVGSLLSVIGYQVNATCCRVPGR